MSGSMEPEIKTGSVVGIKEEDKYFVQDIITVKQQNDPSQTYTHRIIDIIEEEGISYKTKGDANESADPDTVSQDQILGSVFVSIPFIGYLVHFAKEPSGFIFLVIIPSVIIAASEINSLKQEGIKILESRRKKKKENEKVK
jgi:signal peptidase I